MIRARGLLARAALACGALLVAAAPAAAEPLLRPDPAAQAGGAGAATTTTAATVVPAQVQRALADQIRVARAANPTVFAQVSNLHSLLPSVYTASRIQRPTVVRELRLLGRDALLPMLDVLAVGGYSRTLTQQEHDTLEAGLLDVLGELRDRRAEPVLRAAFLNLARPSAVRAAARALGTLCGDGEVALLGAHVRDAGERGPAALDGLGHCRRPESARVLATTLESATDGATLSAAARGLAAASSSWAARTAGAPAANAALASQAASALVRAYVRAQSARMDEEVIRELATALLAVGHADVPRLLEQAAQSAGTPAVREQMTLLARTARLSVPRQ